MKSSVFALVTLCVASRLFAGTFVVTNANDSGPGSLRQALLDSNAVNDADVINFQIPGGGVHTINLASPLPNVPYGAIIDGYTQPGARPNSLAIGTDAVLLVELNGWALPNGVALQLGSFYAVIRGLVINGNLSIVDGGGNRVIGCYIGTNAAGSVSAASGGSVSISGTSANSNIVGGTAPADRNVIASGVGIHGDAYPRPGGLQIQGNYIGVSSDGQSFINPGAPVGISQSDSNVIGGTTLAAGNVIAGYVSLFNANGNVVQNNLIGTDATGMKASPAASGIYLGIGTNPLFFGTTSNNTLSKNVILSSDPLSTAVITLFGAARNTFKANLIGVGADGKTRLGNRPQGIAFQYSASNNSIGGVNTGDGNVIVFDSANQTGTNQQPAAGVSDIDGRGRNFINGNSISGNGGLAIDLVAKGVTPNDPGDKDGIQNYPVLTSAVFANGTVRVTGSLNSLSNTSVRIELLA